jgi:L-threonylcarbamoyladenylate synthase
MTKPYSIITKDTSIVSKYVSEGRVVAFPTGTSYGLAVNALDGFALQRLKNLKNRPDEKTFTVFLSDKIWKKHFSLTSTEKKMLANVPNKALTLLVKPKLSLEHLARNGLVGLRVIDHPLMKDLADKTLLPLTATSANKADVPPCLSSQCIVGSFPGLLSDDQLNEVDSKGASATTYDLSLAAIIDGGELPVSKPTTIAQILNGTVKIIRPGELSLEELKGVL